MNILLLCGNLSYAGAQRQLFELAKGLNHKHNVVVCSITSNVPVLEEFKKNNIRVEVLGLRKIFFISIVFKLNDLLKAHKIQVIYSFLDTANLYSRIMKLLAPSLMVIASERSSDIKKNALNRVIERWLVHFTDLYICNSYAGRQGLEKNYGIKKIEVIHNGIDSTRFLSVKKPFLDINIEGCIIISQIGRIKPDKNYEMFLKVAEGVCNLYPSVIFLAIGDQMNKNNSYQDIILNEWNKLENKDRILFLGARSDIPEILSETDISILTSHREGCSNTVLESMFSKRPLVVTDVGDNKLMLGESNQNFIIKPNDVLDMISKVSILIENKYLRNSIGSENYEKARKEFTTEIMVDKTESVIMSIL